MGGFTTQIEGLKELDRKLGELGTKAARRVIRKALKAGGEVFRVAVAERAPERPDLHSGTALPPGVLARDIEVDMGTADGLPAAIIEPGSYTRHVARWVEYGHRLVKGGHSSMKRGKLQGNGAQIGDVPAYPFIRPGYEASRAEATKVTCESLARSGKPAR